MYKLIFQFHKDKDDGRDSSKDELTEVWFEGYKKSTCQSFVRKILLDSGWTTDEHIQKWCGKILKVKHTSISQAPNCTLKSMHMFILMHIQERGWNMQVPNLHISIRIVYSLVYLLHSDKVF